MAWAQTFGQMAPLLKPYQALLLCHHSYGEGSFSILPLNGSWRSISSIQNQDTGAHHSLRITLIGPDWWPSPHERLNLSAAAERERDGCPPKNLQLVFIVRGTEVQVVQAWQNNIGLGWKSLFAPQHRLEALQTGDLLCHQQQALRSGYL